MKLAEPESRLAHDGQPEPDADDVAAVARTLAGDVDAFAVLVERYRVPVRRCTGAITGNAADAADAAQETFLRLFRGLSQYNPKRPLRPYVMAIAVNCARAHLRWRRAHPEAPVDAPEGVDAAAEADLPHEPLARGELVRAVKDALGGLPDMLREVCVLFYLEECSCRETATILNTSEGAVRIALHRARQRLLRGPLRDWVGAPASAGTETSLR